MNVENMTKLRDHLVWLRDNDKAYKFAMNRWLGLRDHPAAPACSSIGEFDWWLGGEEVISATECGTVACLAGHTALLFGADPGDYVDEFAREVLGLETWEAATLFYGKWSEHQLDDITLDDAIEHLTSLLEGAA